MNNCCLGQVEENTLHNDGVSVLAEGVDIGRPLNMVAVYSARV